MGIAWVVIPCKYTKFYEPRATHAAYLCKFARENSDEMIQRIQTIYMAIAAILALLLSTILVVWQTPEGPYKGFDNPVYMAVAGFVGGVLLANVFNFRKRKLQVVINRIAMMAAIALAGFMIYEYVSALKLDKATGPGFGLAAPLMVVVFIVLANRGIIKDDQLVKSADRFR